MNNLLAIIALAQVQVALAIDLERGGHQPMMTFPPNIYEEDFGEDIPVDDHCCLFSLKPGL